MLNFLCFLFFFCRGLQGEVGDRGVEGGRDDDGFSTKHADTQ